MKRRPRARSFGWGASAAALFMGAAPALAVADPEETWGVRANAMAGAVVADAPEAEAMFVSPAGVLEGPDVRVALTYAWRARYLRTSLSDIEAPSSHGLVLGASATTDALDVKLAGGLMVSLPDGGIESPKGRRSGDWLRYGARGRDVTLGATGALRVHPTFDVGAALQINLGGADRFAVRGTEDLGRLSSDESQTSVLVVPSVGAIFRPRPFVAVGVTVRPSQALEWPGEPHDEPSEALRREAIDRQFAAFSPATWAVGASLHPHPSVRFDFELAWLGWKGFEVQGLTLRPGEERLTLRDRVVPKVGIEWFVPLRSTTLKLPIRAGFSFDPSPVVEAEGLGPVRDRGQGSAGMGLFFPAWHLGLAAYTSLSILPDESGAFPTASGELFDTGGSLSAEF